MAKRSKKAGPMYRQLADTLRNEIQLLSYRVGDYLPSERELAQQYEVTRITIRGALRTLESEGILSSEPHRRRKVIATPSEKGSIELLFFKWQSPFSDPILAEFCTGVAVQAQAMGYRLVLSYISETNAIESHLDSLDRAPPRGMIVIGSYEWYGPIMSRIESAYPVVLVGTPHGSLRADVISPDFEGAMAMAMGHLRTMGYEQVKVLGGGFPEEEGRDQRNFESFKQAGSQFGFAADNLSIFSSRDCCGRVLTPDQSAGLNITDSILDNCRFPMAAVATAPSYAKKILTLATSKGLRVPEDIAIISTQDCQTLQLPPTPITAVSIFGREVGALAVQRLEERLLNPNMPRRMERSAIRLIPRGSCREPDAMITATSAGRLEDPI